MIYLDGEAWDGDIHLVSKSRNDEEPLVFTWPGQVFTAADPCAKLWFDPPPGDYRRFELDVSVVPNGFGDDELRCIAWFVMGQDKPLNEQMIGYIFASSGQVVMRQGLGVKHPKKSKEEAPLRLQTGLRYSFSYVYDALHGCSLAVTHAGAEARLSHDGIPGGVVTLPDGWRLFVGLSNPPGLENPRETPSIGWREDGFELRCFPAGA